MNCTYIITCIFQYCLARSVLYCSRLKPLLDKCKSVVFMQVYACRFHDLNVSDTTKSGPQVDLLTELNKYEPNCEKTGLRGLRPCPTQTGLHNH